MSNEIQAYGEGALDRLRSEPMYDRWIKKQRKPKTIKTYFEAMTRFSQFLNAPLEVCAEQLLSLDRRQAYALMEDFKVYLSQPHLVPKSETPIVCGPATINLTLSALRSFVREAYRSGRVDWILDVSNLPVPEPDRRGPGAEAVGKIFDFLNSAQEDAPELSARNAAIVSLLFFMCMRAEEVRSLNVEHVLMDARTLMVLRKRGVNRVPLTMSTEVIETLAVWLQILDRKTGPLFPSFDSSNKCESELDGRITYQGLRAVIGKLAKDSGYKHKVRLHGFRHSGITYALHVTNGDVRSVQRLSGHKDIKVLMRYDDERRDLGGEVAEKMSRAWREMNEKNAARIRRPGGHR